MCLIINRLLYGKDLPLPLELDRIMVPQKKEHILADYGS